MPRPKQTKPKASPPAKHEKNTAELVADVLSNSGVKDAAVNRVLETLHHGYEVASLDRIDRLVRGLLKFIEDEATEGGQLACSTTECLLALQHVQFRVYDTTRNSSLIDRIASLVSHQSPDHADSSEHTQEPIASTAAGKGSTEFYR